MRHQKGKAVNVCYVHRFETTIELLPCATLSGTLPLVYYLVMAVNGINIVFQEDIVKKNLLSLIDFVDPHSFPLLFGLF